MTVPEAIATALLGGKLPCPYCVREIEHFYVVSRALQKSEKVTSIFHESVGPHKTTISWHEYKGDGHYDTGREILRKVSSLRCGHCLHELDIKIVGKFLGINMVWRTQ